MGDARWMLDRLVLEESLEIVSPTNLALQSNEIQIAKSLRQLSRELRARSQSLRSKNMEVMSHATAVAIQYFELLGDESLRLIHRNS